MIMACFKRAHRLARMVIVIGAMAGCGQDDTATAAGPQQDNLAARSSQAAASSEPPVDEPSQATLVEMRHFSVYQSFRAMLDAPADGQSATSVHAGASDQPGLIDSHGSHFACSSDSLVKLPGD